jgi:ABC-type phosphate transport system substrate-binding protein
MSISKTKESLSKTCHLGIRLVAFVCVLGLNSLSVQANSDILGAGATFPQPIIDTWLKAFQKQQYSPQNMKRWGQRKELDESLLALLILE